MSDKKGYMMTCTRCGGADIGGEVHHSEDCLIGKATRRLELLRRAHTALMCYTVSHGTPMTDLIDELAKELADAKSD